MCSRGPLFFFFFLSEILESVQALLAAPLFVLCEVLFEFRYKADMQKRVKAKALLNIQEYHASNARKAEGKKED